MPGQSGASFFSSRINLFARLNYYKENSPESESMPHIAESMISNDSGAQTFLIARGKAIQTFSQYEQSLARLYSALLGVDPALAGVTFFRVNNDRSRLEIMGSLIDKKHGDTYQAFWKSLAKILSGLAQERNKIVHWGTVCNITFDDSGKQVDTLALCTPNIWDFTMDSKQIYVHDLYEFIVKCDFVERFINIFTAALTSSISDEWRSLFQQPVSYPPPTNHPLARSQPLQ